MGLAAARRLPLSCPAVKMRTMSVTLHEHEVRLSRPAVRFPVELRVPEGFRLEAAETWPKVEGRVEYVGGRLLFMPPCGDVQQDVVSDLVHLLMRWRETHPDFVVGTNEAGLLLSGEVRGADAAVWARAALSQHTGGFRRVPPLLAVEVAGEDEGEAELTAKAAWYLERGVSTVWLVFPERREVWVSTPGGTSRHGTGETLPAAGGLPDLTPPVDGFFVQLA
jgi:Uma2 family endonuclease